jgi:hypothetical protein
MLILDGHATKNIALLEKTRENHAYKLCASPNSSHKLQPLNVSFILPLSSCYAQDRHGSGRIQAKSSWLLVCT